MTDDEFNAVSRAIAAAWDKHGDKPEVTQAAIEALKPVIERAYHSNHAQGWEAGLEAAARIFERKDMIDSAKICRLLKENLNYGEPQPSSVDRGPDHQDLH